MRPTILVLTLSLLGCTRYEYRLPETGATLEGTITYNGETVQMAQINVLSDKGQSLGVIEDGRYKVERVPLGEIKIGINTETERGNAIGQAMARAKGVNSGPVLKFISLPAKYWDADTSGVTTTVKKGQNTFDIVLKK
jgi:hypothetical protein